MLGIFTITECVLGGLKQFEDRWNMHVFYEIFSFSLLLATVSWGVIGLIIGDYVTRFLMILALELVFPLYKAYYGYKEKTAIFLMRKIITLFITLWIIGDSIFTFYFC